MPDWATALGGQGGGKTAELLLSLQRRKNDKKKGHKKRREDVRDGDLSISFAQIGREAVATGRASSRTYEKRKEGTKRGKMLGVLAKPGLFLGLVRGRKRTEKKERTFVIDQKATSAGAML